MFSFIGRPIVLKIYRKSDRKSFKFLQMMEFDFIRRISKTRFQKFFKENETFVLANKAVSLRDSHLEEFTITNFDRFLKRFFNDFELCDSSKAISYQLDLLYTSIGISLIPLRIQPVRPEVNQHTVGFMS